MKLGTATIRKIGLGDVAVRGGFLGYTSLGDAPDRMEFARPLLDPVGDWATWEAPWMTGDPGYSPNLAAPVFNVTTYGAEPNTDSDDTEAIRDAMEACRTAGGGTVYFPQGIYNVWVTGSDLIALDLFTDLVLEGDGPDKTIINHWGRNDTDPAGLVENRGAIFGNDGLGLDIDGVTIRGMRYTGNAATNEYAGISEGTNPESGLPFSTVGWDTGHKVIRTGGGWDFTNLVIEYCEFDNYRGEIIYASGQQELGNLTIRKSIIRECNASAISTGGNLVVEDCDIYDVLNGTENFCWGDPQAMIIRRCVIEPNRNLTGDGKIGFYGLVYHGFLTSNMLVEDCTFGESISAAIFVAEFGSNVVIQNNTFTDTPGIFTNYLGQYNSAPGVGSEEWSKFVNWEITGNTFTAATVNPENAIFGFNATGATDWLIDDNTVASTGEFEYGIFIRLNSGVAGSYVVSNNVIEDARPVFEYEGPRAVWTNNTVTGEFEFGNEVFSYLDVSDPTPITIAPAWPRHRVIDIGGSTMERVLQVDTDYLEYFPEGYQIELRRTGSAASLSAAEIQPDATWNTLTRGYLLYDGAVLVLEMNASGKFDFVSYTPVATSVPTLTESNPFRFDYSQIALYGQLEANLSPVAAFTFDNFSGIAIGETVDLNYNANVTISHVPGVMEISTAADFVASGTGSLSATRDEDGVLQITIP